MLRRQVCVLSTTMGRSILLPLCVLYLSCNAQFDGNDNAPEVRKQANGCAYTFLLPIPDDGECFEPNEVASSVSPYGEDVSALVKRLQAQGDKIDSLKRIGLQHLWRMDELEANKHELQKANTIQTSRVNELEDENSRLLSELSEQSQEIRRLQRLASQLIELRNAARENATKLEQLKNQLRTCNGGQDDTAGIDIAPREAKLLFDGTSSITYLDESNPIQELAEMTWCFWMKTVAGMTYDDNTVLVHYQSPFSSRATSHSISYAVTFFIEQLWNYRLRTGGGVTLFKRVPRDGHWHHVCMAWVGRIGKGRRWLYVDGTGTILGDGHVETVLGSGTLYLGFRPDIDYRRTEGFVGEMALFNMWDRHLNVDEIAAFAKECGDATEGNVVGWSAMFGGNAERENTVARQKDFCSNGDCEDVDCMTEGACIDAPVGQCSCPSQTSCQSEGRKLRFDGSSRVDVNVNDRVTQIDSLSICMWLKISSSRGTLFSITTPTSTANNAIQKIEFHGFSLAVQTYGGKPSQLVLLPHAGSLEGDGQPMAPRLHCRRARRRPKYHPAHLQRRHDDHQAILQTSHDHARPRDDQPGWVPGHTEHLRRGVRLSVLESRPQK
ncbi:uncharacterized protein [Ptychodera flava]|uniref:uncharacterized protein n=1 Tax=Ptychodera flava TaxID=63121 RepID=UPI003969C2AD